MSIAVKRKAAVHMEDTAMTEMIVHDLKHPLTVVSTILYTLQNPEFRDTPAPVRERHLFLAARALERMNAMIDNIVQVCKLGDGRFPVEREPLRLDALLGVVEEEDRILVENSGRRFQALLAPAALGRFVYGQKQTLQRVLGNFIMNAVGHSPAGSLVTVGAGLSGALKGGVDLWVHNTGFPASEKDLIRALNRFLTFGQERRRVGFGLAFCKLAAEVHQASIRAEFDGDGIRFTWTMASSARMEAGEL